MPRASKKFVGGPLDDLVDSHERAGGQFSRNETLWNISPHRPDHSGLMLAARTTLPHFSVSSPISLPKSAGVPGSTVPPRSASRAFILGSASVALISLLSFSMISTGVFLGAPIPHHTLAW